MLLCLLAVSLVVSGCGDTTEITPADPTPTAAPGEPAGPADPGTPQFGGQLVYASAGDPVNFNPILQSDTTSGWVTARVYSGLVRTGPDLQPTPEVALHWETCDDGLEWTFYLRDDVYFHDGEQLTAHDVAFTFNAIKDPDYTGPRANVFRSLERAEAVSDFEVKFYLNEPFAPMITSLTYGILPAHLYEDESISAMPENPYNRNPVGAGPYTFDRWDVGQHIVLQANPDYFGEGPYIETQVLKFVQDADVAMAALEAGEIDYLGLQAKDYTRIEETYPDRFDLYDYEPLSFTYICLNTERTGLDDARVRRAISMAVDREAIVADVLEGYAYPMYSSHPRASWVYTDEGVFVPERDLAVARALLEEAGFTRGSDGIYEKDGERLSFTVLTNSGNLTREAISLIVQANLRLIGIEIKPEYVEWSVFLENHCWTGNFDMFISGFRLGVDPDQFSFFHSSQCEKNELGRFVGFNRASYANPVVDDLLERGRAQMDRETRLEIYQEFQRVISHEQPWIWLYSPQSRTAIDNKIRNVIESPQGPIWSWHWYIAEQD